MPAFIVTVHRFRPPARKGAILRLGEVQRSGLRTEKALKIRSPLYKCSFSQVVANLASNFGLGLTKLTLFFYIRVPNAVRGQKWNLEP
jgi:hypothetical protein